MKKRTTIPERFFLARTALAMREGRTVTQTELARRVGITPQSWSGYESGESEPAYRLGARIAAALGVTGGWLFFDEGEGPGSVPQFPPPPSTRAVDLEIERGRPPQGRTKRKRGA